MSAQWDEHGATVLPPQKKAIGSQRAVAPQPRHLSHTEIAGLSNYDAFELDLPELMNAAIVVHIDGRIDTPKFKIALTLEPFSHMHPWLVYRRLGAALFVGERVVRMNVQQYNLFTAYDALVAAGDDVAARLAAWPAFQAALRMSNDAQVVIVGPMPNFRIHHVEQFPVGAMTRVNRMLRMAREGDAWAMTRSYRYYLRGSKR